MDIFANASETPTDLCFIMNYHGSDKGSPDNNSWHNYTRYYNELFKNVRNEQLNIFELGIGSINPNIVSNMGPNGKPGASLRGWKQYFSNSQIYGGDIDINILFNEERIKTFYCDQTNGDSIKEMWNNPEVSSKGFDIIIDDAIHIFDYNMNFFENSFRKLNVGGVFIIEDINTHSVDLWNSKLFDLEIRNPNMSFRFYTIPNEKNPHDNRLIIAKREY